MCPITIPQGRAIAIAWPRTVDGHAKSAAYYRIGKDGAEKETMDMDQNTVLVVDDEEDIRQSLQFLLADEGYDIVMACDGKEALDVIPLLPKPAVILLDLQMPRLDGCGVLLDLSKHPEKRDQYAIFLLTANIGLLSPDMVRMLGSEGIPVLSKPFDIDQLTAQVYSAFVRLEEQHRP